MIFDFLYLLSSDGSDSLNDESDDDGYDSRSSGMYSFNDVSLRFDESVVSVSVLGFDIFSPTEVKSKGDVFASDVFFPKVVKSKGGRLLDLFWR